MGVMMKCFGTSGRGELVDGLYLKSFDIEAYDGRGEVSLTSNPEDAMVFPSFIEATEAWRSQSVTRPLRPDGKPNRPLTAMTIEIVPCG